MILALVINKARCGYNGFKYLRLEFEVISFEKQILEGNNTKYLKL